MMFKAGDVVKCINAGRIPTRPDAVPHQVLVVGRKYKVLGGSTQDNVRLDNGWGVYPERLALVTKEDRIREILAEIDANQV